jgi:hypothetical protein
MKSVRGQGANAAVEEKIAVSKTTRRWVDPGHRSRAGIADERLL